MLISPQYGQDRRRDLKIYFLPRLKPWLILQSPAMQELKLTPDKLFRHPVNPEP